MKNLFQHGKFTSHSGKVLDYKIECDALTDEDINTLATLIGEHKLFGQVYGVPKGGERLARALVPWINPAIRSVLIVDDVLTTGRSMEEARKLFFPQFPCHGIVIFARGVTPYWVEPLFKLPVWAWGIQ